jgi:hypothetical protein
MAWLSPNIGDERSLSGDERLIIASNTYITSLLMFDTYILQGVGTEIVLAKRSKT